MTIHPVLLIYISRYIIACTGSLCQSDIGKYRHYCSLIKIIFCLFLQITWLFICLQACYFQIPLPVEFMPSDTFFVDGQKGTCISSVADYPIKTLVFESNHFKLMLEVVAEICSCLRGKLILYNLLISDRGRKIFLFLQVNGIWFYFWLQTAFLYLVGITFLVVLFFLGAYDLHSSY